ncbi:MAG: ABC transporter permease, partial [Bacteroidota bacterium]
MNTPSPPKWAERFLAWFCRDELYDAIRGDLEELYARNYRKYGHRKASWIFIGHVITFFQPFALKSFSLLLPLNPTLMFRQNLLFAYRHLLWNKSSFLINLIGLSTGIACALLIYLWVNDELSMDKFHEHDHRLYQVMEYRKTAKDTRVGEYTAGLLAESLAQEIPGVEFAAASRVRTEPKTLSVGDKHLKAIVQYASEDFFNIFSYELIQGNVDQILSEKNSIVISEELALKLFNTIQHVIGKTILFEHEQSYQVSGIFAGTPKNSSTQFDFVLPFDIYKESNPGVLDWNFNTTKTYLLLQNKVSSDFFGEKIAHFLETKRDNTTGGVSTLLLRPYSSAYLYGKYENGEQTGGRISYVKLFSAIAIFILLIACINFINLSTAKASSRFKEIGVKKVFGSSRLALINQYLSESLVTAIVALIVAFLLVILFLPKFNQITGKEISLLIDSSLIVVLLGTILLTGLVAGSYPALYLSAFNPVKILKGKFYSSAGELWTRKGLVTFQFALSVILIMAVLVVYQQISYMQNKHLGYDRENILYFEVEGKVAEKLEFFLSEVKNLPGIKDAAGIGQSVVGGSLNSFSIDQWPGKPEGKAFPSFEVRPVTYGMIELLGIPMLEGRTFSKDFGSEDTKIIFNEAAIEMMGLENPIG